MDRIPFDQLYATVEGVHQQQDLKLSQNEAYTATSIPVETNSTTLSMDLDHLYEVVEGEYQQEELLQIEINIYDSPYPANQNWSAPCKCGKGMPALRWKGGVNLQPCLCHKQR
jgi:hypothetical protein